MTPMGNPQTGFHFVFTCAHKTNVLAKNRSPLDNIGIHFLQIKTPDLLLGKGILINRGMIYGSSSWVSVNFKLFMIRSNKRNEITTHSLLYSDTRKISILSIPTHDSDLYQSLQAFTSCSMTGWGIGASLHLRFRPIAQARSLLWW
jgi:hypothetical protein